MDDTDGRVNQQRSEAGNVLDESPLGKQIGRKGVWEPQALLYRESKGETGYMFKNVSLCNDSSYTEKRYIIQGRSFDVEVPSLFT